MECLERYGNSLFRLSRGFTVSLVIGLIIGILSSWFYHQNILVSQELVEACHDPRLKAKTDKMPKTVHTVHEFRLPTKYFPQHYDIEIEPNLHTKTFTGYVSINVVITQNCYHIKLHSGDLHIVNVEFTDVDMRRDNSQMSRISTDIFPYLVVEKIDRSVFEEGVEVRLNIKYRGDLNKTFHGLYHTSYVDDNTLRHVVATNLKPDYARYAFPCFDEPNLRTTYTFSIKAPPEYRALTNFQSHMLHRAKGIKIYKFLDEEFSMSSYQVAILIIDMDSIQYFIKKSNALRIFGTSTALSHKLKWAAECAKAMFEHYVEYFRIDYPLSKLDIVAIPNIQYEAAESWGLITFKESQIVYTNTTHSLQDQKRVAALIAREMARTWINTLVKIDWWDNLWLNEGFANFMQYRGLASIRTDWKMMEEFLMEQVHPALALDSSERPIRLLHTVENANDIANSTNSDRYKKAASIFGMLENYMDDSFHTIFTKFLVKYKDGMVNHTEFISEFQDQNKYKAGQIWETFMRQNGYPLINVKSTKNGYELTQEPFSDDREKVFEKDVPALMDVKTKFGSPLPPHLIGQRQESRSKYNIWSIPITYQYFPSDQEPSKVVFKYSDSKITIPKIANKLVKLNVGQIGYYRVNYPKSYWYQLIEYFPEMDVPNRMHMLEETFALAKANRTEYEVPLNLTKKLVNETDYNTLKVTLVILEEIFSYLASSSKEPAFRNYIKSLINATYHKYTWNVTEHEDESSRMSRFFTLRIACMVGHEYCLKDASDKLNTWLETKPGNITLSPELGDILCKYGMETATVPMWNKLYERYRIETTPKIKLRYLRGLASTQNPSQLAKLMVMVENIRPQDYFILLGYISEHPYGASVVWNHLRFDYDDIENRFGVDNPELAELLPAVTRWFSTKTKYHEMETYYEEYAHSRNKITKSCAESMHNVKLRMKWVSKYKTDFETWLEHIKIKQ